MPTGIFAAGEYARLRSWFTYNPADPGRASPDDADVLRLVRLIAPNSSAADLGGAVSLNLLLEPEGLVLRVHQPFVSRQRLVAAQNVRGWLAGKGLTVPMAVPWRGSTVLRCNRHLVELERFMEHSRQRPSRGSYVWLFGALGELHHAMESATLPVPRPILATNTSPSTLRRWSAATRAAIEHDPRAADIGCELDSLILELARVWVPATHLPRQLIHGDFHLSNAGLTPAGQSVFLDFGSMTFAPRVHDVAYALAHMVFAINDYQGADPLVFPWEELPQLLRAYETAAGWSLTDLERLALAPYTAAVALHDAARAGFFTNPVAVLHEKHRFFELTRWLLARRAGVA